MKNTFKVVSIALMAVFMFTTTTCFGQSGGQTINSPEALKTYLDKQPVNGPDKPIRVTMSANAPMLPKIREAIEAAGKYVSLTLSGNALTTIPDQAFSECETLVSITIPNGVTSIGVWAFIRCTNLASVTIPDSVTSIGAFAFAETAWLNKQPNGVVYINKIAYVYKGTMPANTSIILLDGTKGIANQAFNNCTGLTSITIGNSVTSIGRHAFSDCRNLTSVTIGNSVTSIGENAFENCNSLTSVNIPNSVTSIERSTFGNCTSLTSVTIPNSVTSIGYGAFENCNSLTSVTFQGTIASDKLGSYNFRGDLIEKYLAGGVGTYKTTAPVNDRSVWTKQ